MPFVRTQTSCSSLDKAPVKPTLELEVPHGRKGGVTATHVPSKRATNATAVPVVIMAMAADRRANSAGDTLRIPRAHNRLERHK